MQANSPIPPSAFEGALDAARRGEPGAMERLFDDLYPKVQLQVHRHLVRELGNDRRWMASLFSTGDVVQEVFRNLMSDLDAIQARTEEGFVGYLATVIRNRVIDSIRFHQAARRDQRRVNTDIDDVQVASAEKTPSLQAGSKEELETFSRALESFPERSQPLLRERLERDTPFKDLAERLGFPSPDAARKAFYAAQARLLMRMGGGNNPSHPSS